MSSKESPNKDAVLSNIQNLSGEQFEQFIEEFWSVLGWNTHITTYHNDGGVDVIAQKEIPVFCRMAIQAKKSTNSINRTTVQHYASLGLLSGVDVSVLATTGTFSDPAISAAKHYGLRLLDGERIVERLIQTNNTNIVYRILGRTTTPNSLENVHSNQFSRERSDSFEPF